MTDSALPATTLEGERRTPTIAASSGVRGVGRRFALDRQWLILVVLGGLLLVGAQLRLDHLESRGMGHVESYTPGLPFPPTISSPAPRLTFGRSISGPMFEEPHPPAWYAVMWPWTRLFGTDLFTIRLPSVIFGVASIALIYRLGVLAHGWPTGLVAAALLTFNGDDLLFSQVARPTSMAVLLSILSTTLLLLTVRGGTVARQRVYLALYLALTLLGMATLYYYWPILAAQMVWVGLRGARESVTLRPLLRWQWLLVILGSPLLTLAIFQRFQSFLDSDSLAIMAQFLEFGFLFEPDNFGVLATQPYIPDVVRLALPFVCAALIVLGLIRTRWRSGTSGRVDVPRLPLRWVGLAAGLAFATILVETAFFEHHRPGRAVALLASSLAPIAIVGGVWLAARAAVLERLALRLLPVAPFPDNSVSLMYVMTVVPVAIITGVSLFIPFFAARHMLLFTPYLLIITSRGIVELFHLSRRRLVRVGAAAFVAGLLAVHLSSIAYSRDRLVTLVDYKGLASAWIPSIQRGALILVQPQWAVTPIFYYLNCKQYMCVGNNYAASVQQQRPSQVWVLSTGASLSLPSEFGPALVGYQHVRDVTARSIRAELYSPE